jgi:hypothetical protein
MTEYDLLALHREMERRWYAKWLAQQRARIAKVFADRDHHRREP